MSYTEDCQIADEQELERIERLAKLQEEWVGPNKVPKAKVVSESVTLKSRVIKPLLAIVGVVSAVFGFLFDLLSVIKEALFERFEAVMVIAFCILAAGAIYGVCHLSGIAKEQNKEKTDVNTILAKEYLLKNFPNKQYILTCHKRGCNIKFRTIPEKTIECTTDNGCWEIRP